jgi:hypothetical protein
MTIGEGVKELLPGSGGGMGSNSMSNIRVAYLAPTGQLDCQDNSLGKSESNDDVKYFLWNCGEGEI